MENLEETVTEAMRDDIREAHHMFCSKKSDEHGVSLDKVADIVVEELEGIVIPEEESEELRARAAKEGKTFKEKVIEYVGRGLDDDAAFDRARRIAERNGEWGSGGENTPPTLMN